MYSLCAYLVESFEHLTKRHQSDLPFLEIKKNYHHLTRKSDALLVAGGGLALTPDVVKNYYASVEAEHNDIRAKVEELLTNYQVHDGVFFFFELTVIVSHLIESRQDGTLYLINIIDLVDTAMG